MPTNIDYQAVASQLHGRLKEAEIENSRLRTKVEQQRERIERMLELLYKTPIHPNITEAIAEGILEEVEPALRNYWLVTQYQDEADRLRKLLQCD